MKRLTTKLTRAASFALSSLLLLAATTARPQAPAPQAPESKTVTIILTAVGKDGRAFTSLKAEDVSVEEDGRPRVVTGLEHRSDLPLLLAIGLDSSTSQERVIDGTKMTAGELVRNVMRPGTDRAAVFSFTNETTLEQEMTADAAKVREGIARVKVASPTLPGAFGAIVTGPIPKSPPNMPGTTAVWESVAAVCDDLLSQTSAPGRRAIVLITDGVDTSSTIELDDAVRSALQTNAAVYAVGIGDQDYAGLERDSLRKLSERTGGRAFFPKKVKNLPEVFAGLREHLFSAYVLTFTTPYTRPDGSFRKLKVTLRGEAARRAGVEVDFPHGYFAGNAPPALRD
ncbi:MAG TPA: VWA domain-containing protein [Pyrinomonadaceae bacterium]|jgi:Ca-activated chloride channel family protein|nr:VWA domain-containing protein [Pyrinomonadaceae bacterium]